MAPTTRDLAKEPGTASLNRDIREVVREEPVMRARILAALDDGPRTIPQIAGAIGAPTHETLLWVMGMRRHGWLAEIKGATVDGYFQYEPTGRVAR